MKHIKLLILPFLLLLSSCFEMTSPNPEIGYENWISIINLDGSVDTYLQEGGGSCYFIPDPSNGEEEIVLVITRGSIYTMSLEGLVLNILFAADEGYDILYRQTDISHSKNKLVLNYLNRLILIDLVTSSYMQLPLSEEYIWGSPSFSINDSSILCSSTRNETRFLTEIDLSNYEINFIYSSETIALTNPKWINTETVIAVQYDEDCIYEDKLVSIDTSSGEITVIDSLLHRLFDVNVEKGLIVYLTQDSKSIKILSQESLSILGELSSEYPVIKPPVFSTNGNWVIWGNNLYNVPTKEVKELDVTIINSWNYRFNLRFNKDVTKLVGTIKSGIPETPDKGDNHE